MNDDCVAEEWLSFNDLFIIKPLKLFYYFYLCSCFDFESLDYLRIISRKSVLDVRKSFVFGGGGGQRQFSLAPDIDMFYFRPK